MQSKMNAGVEYPSVPVPQDVKPSSALTNIYKDAEQQFVANMSWRKLQSAITGASADSCAKQDSTAGYYQICGKCG